MSREASEEKSETARGKDRTPLSMIIPAAGLAAGALVIGVLAVGVLPGLDHAVQAGAVRFQDQGAYRAAVLAGRATAHPAALFPAGDTGITAADVAIGAASAAAALVVAGLSLYWRRLPLPRRRAESGPFLACRSGPSRAASSTTT